MYSKYIKWIVFLISLVILLALSVLLSLSSGEVKITYNEIIKILSAKSGLEYTVLTQIRLPRLLLAIAIGGGLSLSGAILQGIYRNPLVEPYTLGISGGAALGIAIAIVFSLNTAGY